LDRIVAIKLLPADLGDKQGFAARFEREAHAMAKLNHPNIITVFDYGRTSEGRLYYVMEYVDGRNLSEVIRGEGVDASQALAIAAQLCDALAYAHAEGVVHRDIKPANVLLDHRNRVKVADFGLARLIGPSPDSSTLTMTGTVMGTADYMAPEQRGGMNVDHRADIYSLGVILYEMFCHELPKGVFALPSKRTGCDSGVDEIISRALQQTPELRYESTQQMKADVECLRAPGGSGRQLPRRRRTRMLWRVGTLVAALIVIGFWLGRGTMPPHAAKVSTPTTAAKDAAAEAARVIDELAKLNPAFDAKGASWKIENDDLVEMSVDISAVTRLEPLRTLPTLKRLRLGRASQAGVLETLAALRGLPLEWLEVHNAQISDLSPLKGMPLNWFVCQGSDVSDLTPLQGCPLQALGINGTDVSNLDPLSGMHLRFLNCGRTDVSNPAPLKGMPLTDVNISRTRVSDLTPLKGMKLTRLICSQALIADLTPIAGMPLKELDCDFSAPRDEELLRSLTTLEKINGSSAAAFWKEFGR
jgi:hypothetical protein